MRVYGVVKITISYDTLTGVESCDALIILAGLVFLYFLMMKVIEIPWRVEYEG